MLITDDESLRTTLLSNVCPLVKSLTTLNISLRCLILFPLVYDVNAVQSAIVLFDISLRLFTLSNFIMLSIDLILLFLSSACASAVVVTDDPPPPSNVTVGVVKYPEPPLVNVMPVTLPSPIIAVAVAPDPPPPLIRTRGAEVYPLPVLSTIIDPMLNLKFSAYCFQGLVSYTSGNVLSSCLSVGGIN